MTEPLILHELPPSPNNVRARLALKFKGLAYETRIVSGFDDRSALVELSGQPLTPVLQHGDRVIFDSSAILRYLDANFRDAPPLFSASRDEMREIEAWEIRTRTVLIEPVGAIFEQAFAPEVDEVKIAAANRQMHEATAPIEARLQESDWLVSGRLTAADLFCAPVVATTAMPASPGGPLAKVTGFFHAHFRLGEGREKTKAWLGRVMAFDR